MNILKYLGIPYEERGNPPQSADCWTLIRHYAKNELGIVLPDYMYSPSTFMVDAANLLATAPLGDAWEALQAPQTNAVLLFTMAGATTHCGLYLGDGDFLHTLAGRRSCVERLTDNAWNRRLAGIYRWKC
jgi:cell wall-associated NlpC family hydrolase